MTTIDYDALEKRLRDHENEGVTSSDRFYLRNEAADAIRDLRAEVAGLHIDKLSLLDVEAQQAGIAQHLRLELIIARATQRGPLQKYIDDLRAERDALLTLLRDLDADEMTDYRKTLSVRVKAALAAQERKP